MIACRPRTGPPQELRYCKGLGHACEQAVLQKPIIARPKTMLCQTNSDSISSS